LAPETVAIITCEHASNAVPEDCAHLFAGAQKLLNTHRAFDPGAGDLARALAQALGAPLFLGRYTRLLVDLNRSETGKGLFSRFTAGLDESQRRALVDKYHRPYRAEVEQVVKQAVARGASVIHVSCHSFTPVLRGKVRKVDVGLLYDPKREGEKALCGMLRSRILRRARGLRVRMNLPYRGWTDGLTTWLRRIFPRAYLGVELEINQALYRPGRAWEEMKKSLAGSLCETLDGFSPSARV